MSPDQPPPPVPAAADAIGVTAPSRSNSFSQQSRTSADSQTAADFLRDQQLLEADAREALPYSIDSCTKILGPLRQNVFACLTCNPPPPKPGDPWTPAGVCYACSVQCHGEHNLVEIFQKRNFTCDCGTTRIPATSPCTLRTNDATNTKGGVHSEEADANNKYNQNFRNRFCGCECDYDPFQQKGTMFQCLGLGTQDQGGCGEDWYHPGCLVGMGPNCIAEEGAEQPEKKTDEAVVDDEDDPPMPPGFPEEEDFEGFLCYKCVESNPWIKLYAGTAGFLPAVFLDPAEKPFKPEVDDAATKKRKADGDAEEQVEAKRVKNEPPEAVKSPTTQSKPEPDSPSSSSNCKQSRSPPAPAGRFSVFFKDGFRNHLCRCTACHRRMALDHPQLLEEEDVYEPPLSADGSQHGGGGSTHGSGSLLERGESALRNVDRVRAIEGVMAYNHLKERLKPFFQQFAESGRAVGAEDIKAYFAQLRGDEQGIREAAAAAAGSGDGHGGGSGEGGARREQSGY
ncbi:putative zinc finger in n-recognin (UBR box) domain-containing protein [Hirsutella rhossiliensis]|uniref:Zinc finger in n-recognin (UBR box) domain-containing protein n=1 Tax=Hirsutella rhossiliensis TaxID=111463 RepID=A0A9P8N5M6_9HYPO|nr:putative zinc finger in n-recognin (UBR box) domain-containing protein [Hirsutella rhossiliensis]KAH0967412.1 putative zinc finger in n-recognin (UBR box) domain-containing protein [Hirsutella rhossiliensis]